MKKDKTYQNLLGKMLIMENMGEILYNVLVSESKDNNLKPIYKRLALNERETAECVEEEILATDKNHRILISGVVLNLTRIICSILTARQLAWILKTVLKRRIYSKWYKRYKDNNQDFWLTLLNHENLQHKLLGPFWNN